MVSGLTVLHANPEFRGQHPSHTPKRCLSQAIGGCQEWYPTGSHHRIHPQRGNKCKHKKALGGGEGMDHGNNSHVQHNGSNCMVCITDSRGPTRTTEFVVMARATPCLMVWQALWVRQSCPVVELLSGKRGETAREYLFGWKGWAIASHATEELFSIFKQTEIFTVEQALLRL